MWENHEFNMTGENYDVPPGAKPISFSKLILANWPNLKHSGFPGCSALTNNLDRGRLSRSYVAAGDLVLEVVAHVEEEGDHLRYC